MEPTPAKKDIVQQLQKDIISMQGHRAKSGNGRFNSGLGVIEQSFPNGTFPTGAIHEFLSAAPEDATATNGFVASLLGRLMQNNGSCLWIGTKRTVFAPALRMFGIEPDRIIFVDLKNEKDVLWTVEEALKCGSLSAVIGEFSNLNFMESRRLQLAVEESHVTGFIHRYNPRTVDNLACVSRWKIKSLASTTIDGLPGVGHPCWDVQLLKIRNGVPGNWQMEWAAGRLKNVAQEPTVFPNVYNIII